MIVVLYFIIVMGFKVIVECVSCIYYVGCWLHGLMVLVLLQVLQFLVVMVCELWGLLRRVFIITVAFWLLLLLLFDALLINFVCYLLWFILLLYFYTGD